MLVCAEIKEGSIAFGDDGCEGRKGESDLNDDSGGKIEVSIEEELFSDD